MPLARTSLAAVAALAALALPAAADAKGKDPAKHASKHERTAEKGGHGKQRGHKVSVLLRGSWSAGTLQVTGGNRAAKRLGLVGDAVELDLAGAKLKVRDRDGDGDRDGEDLRDGDRVVVQVRLARGDAAEGALTVRKLVARAKGADDHGTDDGAEDEAGDDNGADDAGGDNGTDAPGTDDSGVDA
jgi:hypothetical protein